jgi:molecular chaperone GrpE (heat shock protein)
MTRSPSEIEREAKVVGQHAAKNTMPDNSIIQVLCALVEELADNVQRLEAEIKQLKQRKP